MRHLASVRVGDRSIISTGSKVTTNGMLSPNCRPLYKLLHGALMMTVREENLPARLTLRTSRDLVLNTLRKDTGQCVESALNKRSHEYHATGCRIYRNLQKGRKIPGEPDRSG